MTLYMFSDAYIPNEYTYLYAPIEGDIKDRGIYHLDGWNRNMTISSTHATSNGTDSALLWDYSGVEEPGGIVPPLSITAWGKAIGTHPSPDHPILIGYYNGTNKTMYAIGFVQNNSQAFMTYLQELIAWNDVLYTIDTTQWHCYGMATDGPNGYFYIDGQLVATKTNRPTTGGPDGSVSYAGLLNRGGGNILYGKGGGAIIETRLNNQSWFANYYNKTKDFYLAL